MAEQLLIDDESIHYISIREHAEKISNIICKHLSSLNLKKEDIVITDAMAGVGGNTISFAGHFKFVNAIEIDPLRAKYLKNNIDIYELLNVKVFNDNCLNLLKTIDLQHVIFLDPLWGLSYKKYNNLKLFIGEVSIEQVCIDLMEKELVFRPQIIVFKLPKNYDLHYFYSKLKNKSIFHYDLKKMIILIIVTN